MVHSGEDAVLAADETEVQDPRPNSITLPAG
jgi:hypothetical protein